MKTLFLSQLLTLSVAASLPSIESEMKPVPGVSALRALGVPPVSPEFHRRVRQYENTRSASLLDVSTEAKQVLISTRFGTTSQLHRVDHPMGARLQLTFEDEPITSAKFLPGNPRFLFYLGDVGGGEFYQLYRLDLDSGKAELLTDGKSRHSALHLSPDGKRLAYAGTGRNGKDADVYVAEVANPKNARRLTEFEGSWAPMDFSPDGQSLLIKRERSSTDGELHLWDVSTGKGRQLAPTQGKAEITIARFSPNRSAIYLATDQYSDFNQLYRLDLQGGGAPSPLSGAIPWNVEHLAIAANGSRVAFSVNEEGYSRLYLLEGERGQPALVDLPKGVISQLQFARQDSRRLFLTHETARTPQDVWELDVVSRKLTRWTQSEMGGLKEGMLIEPRLVRYPSKDKVSVPALVYHPTHSGISKMPVVIIWHGGPESQSRPAFSSFRQLLASEFGIAVILPNVRGSDGYGKRYLSMDDGVSREASLADIGATLDWIAQQPNFDSQRVGVYGGSYGGYMVLATATFFPTRIRAAVEGFGISSLPSFLKNTQAYRRDLRRAEYGDERIPEIRAVQERISPLFKASEIQAALFVLQGKNDPRVPASESEQIVEAVRSRGKKVWYLLAENEGHGFRKKDNLDFSQTAAALFLEQNLLNH